MLVILDVHLKRGDFVLVSEFIKDDNRKAKIKC